nr:hypothetical protein [Chrysovirus sp.]
MSAEKRVIDYMRGLPQGAMHRELYHTKFMEQYNSTLEQQVDGVEVEKSLISPGEKEILSHLNIQDKFTKKNMAEGFGLSYMVSLGEGKRIKRCQDVELNFQCCREWFLTPSSSRALYSTKESTMNIMDDEQRRMIMSKCPSLSGAEASGVYMAAIHERLSVPTDLRHLFTKMYLYLQDYTLAVVSRHTGMSASEDIAFRIMPQLDDLSRLATVADHDIVIDADGFTAEQLSLLCLSGLEYPSVWYAGEHNIYNSCQMDADDLVVVSSGGIQVDTSFVWGSPDRMYQMMWIIAQKLNAVGCLTYVIETMRGKCKMMADIVAKTDCEEVNSMMPLSYCVSTSFAQYREKQVISVMPGYVSTSVALVADLLYGMSFKAIASTVAETLGAMGKVVSSSTPATNPTINSLMRDYGMQHTDAESNFMLRNFEMFSRKPTKWAIGGVMKQYALQLAEDVMMGLDIELPAILLTVPALTAIHTSFGLARGWYGDSENILNQSKKDRLENTDALCAVGWLTGIRKCRPQVYRNRLGKKHLMVSAEERKLKAECQNDCRVRDVEFWMREDLSGRVDEIEEAGSNLYRIAFAGTRCTLVFSYEAQMWVDVAAQDYSRLRRETTIGNLTKRERDTMSKVQPVTVNWGPPPTHKHGIPENALEYMRSLSRGEAIIPNTKPRHVRVNSAGVPVVAPFIEDNEDRNEFLNYQKPDISEGQEIRFSEIDVPGDGSCGIHALVKDLSVNGRIRESDAAKATSVFSGETASKSFHDANELAALCQSWGMGMDLLDKTSGRVVRYGAPDAEYRATIIRDGMHFKTGRLRDDGAHSMLVSHLEEQSTPPEEFVAQVKSYGSLFGGSPVLS